MLEEAKLDTLTPARFNHAKDMSAIDDLKFYGENADAHGEGLKQLLAVFSGLYEHMPETQKTS
ncbi:MAG: hypothetical protein WC782_07190 [Methylococcaceae bacterium]|jgi:hypothetical protein